MTPDLAAPRGVLQQRRRRGPGAWRGVRLRLVQSPDGANHGGPPRFWTIVAIALALRQSPCRPGFASKAEAEETVSGTKTAARTVQVQGETAATITRATRSALRQLKLVCKR